MSSEKRLMLFIVMSGAILFGYNILLPPKKPATQAYQQAAASTPVAAESASIKTAAPIKEKPTSIKSAPEKTYEMENSLVKITFSSTGAVMNSYKLKKFSDAATGKEQTMLELIPSSSSYSYMGLDSVG
ncbi:MAG TPA: hypothetical protein P5511_00335, partial [Candidatus Goldiibacteriota bacterium]|nr:hypothetical protein [Candidatus Goldiibacteriota bacterium]